MVIFKRSDFPLSEIQFFTLLTVAYCLLLILFKLLIYT